MQKSPSSEPLKHPFSSKLLAKKFQAIQDFILKVPSVLELEGTKMVVERQESELRQSNGMISIQDQYFRRLADERTTTATTTTTKNLIPEVTMKQNVVRQQQGYGKKIMFSSPSYFGLESLVILVCLTASLLILPLILPPLPPPPFMLLSLPICILMGLVILAFSSSSGRGVSNYKYM
ncbi:hypothetical protein LIER_37818 [Lithospermum erythrorhizon]|uniref:Uncharacterized protein n=1 Tax=Lithospermum erythrorhizon TaxID=34254 RepID=A0AAV3PSW4_LITER